MRTGRTTTAISASHVFAITANATQRRNRPIVSEAATGTPIMQRGKRGFTCGYVEPVSRGFGTN
jgi:hypothetical protein